MTSFDWTGALERAHAHAPFLSRAMDRLPDLVALLAAGDGEAALAYARKAGTDATDLPTALRLEKRALALALAIGDLAGAFPLLKITRALSDFADRAMDAAIADAIHRRVPDAEPAGFLALALGKHGAQELNYSSDIDPILLYDPALLPRRERDEPAEAAQRVARTLVETLAHQTGDGYVFRVDLRLRPASEVSPLAIPIDAALGHYESSALAWERAAFIRARACAGDVQAGEAFLSAIRPFVWRKSLDFGAIAEIGRLTAQIRSNTKGAWLVGPGFDLKKGRGGIREIEFYAQTHQLIHGGRNPALRLRGTRATLDALAEAGLIPAEDARLLGDSYDRLRTLEHRLQMVADQQTHQLPGDWEAIANVAALDGIPDSDTLLAEITAITQGVGERYDALIAASAGPDASPRIVPTGSETLVDELRRLGFADPEELAARVRAWDSGKIRALRSEAARAAFEAVQPQLLEALAGSPEPDRAFLRWEHLLAGLPSAINLFNLLEARPALLQLLGRILSLAPTLAEELGRRADLLDPLIDASAFDPPGSVAELVADFARGEAGDDYQRVLDRVRRRVGDLRFALGVQLIEGATDPLLISEALSRVAEAAIEVLAAATIAEFELPHGRIEGSELTVLGLGRLGGGALTHASDLDLIYLYSGDPGGRESDGPRPIGASVYFNRLSQRISAALSVPTAEGALYEVDTRLRPSGTQGPIAVSFDAFERYQMEQAWTWEHMALCRARPLFGSPQAREALQDIVCQALRKDRDPAKLRQDVLDMRAEMARHKPAKGPLDIKLLRGGLVDLEFIVHYLQLRTGEGLVPGLEVAIEQLVAAGHLPADLITAREALARLLVAARLIAPDSEAPPPSAREALARACLCADWDAVLAGIATARRAVAAAWAGTFGETLEIDG